MHPCLELYEVIRAIFGFIRPQDGSALRALSSAMQACKTFYEPAADTLWHTLDDLTPLVRCLPSHLWYVKSLEGESGIECTVHLTRELDETEWEIILKHSHRVKFLGPGNAGIIRDTVRKPTWRLSPSALKGLTVWLWSRGREVDSSKGLLPNLTRLHWSFESNGDQSSNCIPFVGGQHLKELIITGDDDSSAANSNALGTMIHAFSLIPQHNPNITLFSFEIFPGSSWNAIVGPLSELIQALPHLEKLNCCLPFLDDAYRYLAHLPTLTVLNGSLPPLRAHPVLTEPSESPIFPHLTELELDAMELGSCVTLITRMGSVGMESLSVSTNVAGLITIEDTRDLFVALRRQPSLKTLSLCQRKISFEPNTPIPDGPDQTLLPHDFAPLLELRNLTGLSLSFDIALDIDDACIRAMAEAWPQLRTLSAYSPKEIGARPKVTLAGLIHLAELCPFLYALALNLDPSIVNPDLRAAAKRLKRKNHGLRFLSIFYWSPLGNAALFADSLLNLFPVVMVNTIPVCQREGNERMVVEWGTFQAFLKGFSAARGSEGSVRSSDADLGVSTEN